MSDVEGNAYLIELLMMLILIVSVIGFLWLVFQLIGTWRVYKKLGLQPWACLIPVYTTWVLSNRVLTRNIAIGATVTAAITCLVQFLYSALDKPDSLYMLLGLATLVTFVFDCLICNALSKTFGYGVGFTVGLVLLPPVFYMILGFNERMPLDMSSRPALPAPSDDGSLGASEGGSPISSEGSSPFIED